MSRAKTGPPGVKAGEGVRAAVMQSGSLKEEKDDDDDVDVFEFLSFLLFDSMFNLLNNKKKEQHKLKIVVFQCVDRVH